MLLEITSDKLAKDNANGRAHFDKLAQAIGVPSSGKEIVTGGPGFKDYEVTLIVEKVLGTNNP